MEKQPKASSLGLKLMCSIMVIVMPVFTLLVVMVRQDILEMSKEKLILQSQSGAKAVGTWAERILSELDIYKDMIEKVGMDDPKVFELMGISYPNHEEYPYGLYWGNREGAYFDSSGWVPDESYVPAERIWYQEGLKRDHFGFGEPYVDAMTGEACISASARVSNSSVESVVAADVYLDYASKVVTDIAGDEIDYAFFVTRQSRSILADPDISVVGRPLNSKKNTRLYQNIDRILADGQTGQHEIKGNDGRYITNIIHIEPVDWYFVTCMSQKEALGELDRMMLIMVAVSSLACLLLVLITLRSAKQIALIGTRARTDQLTGLLNRSGFRQTVEEVMAATPGQGILIMMDLDNFKQINDRHGHPEGDIVLRNFARQLEMFFNHDDDITARLGGDEFSVFVGRPLTFAEAEEMLSTFVNRAWEIFASQYPEDNLSVSAGAVFTPEKATAGELYRQADAALYEAKRNGKNRFLLTDKNV